MRRDRLIFEVPADWTEHDELILDGLIQAAERRTGEREQDDNPEEERERQDL